MTITIGEPGAWICGVGMLGSTFLIIALVSALLSDREAK